MRDTVSVSALRSALAAIDNARSVRLRDLPASPAAPIAESAWGLGAGDVPRTELSDHEIAAIVAGEAASRTAAARDYAGLGGILEAERLNAESRVLSVLLAGE